MRVLRPFVLALWSGLLVTVGGLVAPTLFQLLPDRHLAGSLAGEFFRRATLLSVLAALVLVIGARTPRERLTSVLPAVWLSASEYGVRPLLEAARAAGGATGQAFLVWHAVSTVLYLAGTASALWLLAAELRAAR